jgi:hypothetical protein
MNKNVTQLLTETGSAIALLLKKDSDINGNIDTALGTKSPIAVANLVIEMTTLSSYETEIATGKKLARMFNLTPSGIQMRYSLLNGIQTTEGLYFSVIRVLDSMTFRQNILSRYSPTT